MNDSLPDDLFRNRISAALRELAQPESDADLDEALDAVEAEPLDERTARRILDSVRESIAAARATGPVGSPASRVGAVIESPSPAATPRHEGNGHAPHAPRPAKALASIVVEPARDRRGFGWVVASCAVLVAATFGILAQVDRTSPRVNWTDARPVDAFEARLVRASRGVRTPAVEAAPAKVELGQVIATGPREKRRVTLPDGSILSINEASRVTVTSARRVRLDQGEVFVEVVPVAHRPRDGQVATADRFVVETPTRSVTALGTKFVVQAQPHETRVVVTQGKVQVSGVKAALPAGQELTIDDEGAVDVRPAKRTSYVVDWVKDLIAAGAAFVPPSAHSGGSITVVDPNGQEMKLSLRKFHVDVHIEDGFARTTIDQTYFNHTWQQLEGTFRFPLPADASLSRLAMYVNGTLMEGGMVERDHGRNVFEQIRHTRRDPALLEWVDGSTFQMRVFPLEARQEKRILLSYSQRLPLDYGKSVYRFPGGHNLDGVRLWSTEVRVKGAAGRKWHSSSHLLESRPDAGDLVLTGREEHALLDRDLVVELDETPMADRVAAAATGAAPRWSVFEQDGFRYVMLRQRPALEAPRVRAARHWIFLVENSGDRDSLTAATQRQIVKTWLENVEHGDTLSLVRASTEPTLFRGDSVPCSIDNAAAALKFLDERPPLGALDLGQALDAVRQLARRDRETWIVHLGTGIPVLGERDANVLLRRLPEQARYLGVAVGKRWSKSFMETAASRTSGAVTQINPDEPVTWKAFETLSQLNAPRLTQLAIKAGDAAVGDFQPLTKQIAHGQELAAVARFAADRPLPKSLQIVGQLDGRAYLQDVTLPASLGEPLEQLRANKSADGVAAPTVAGHLPRTWARQEIDRLTALGLTEHRAEIIQLSKSMYVMSPFTSLLVLETEAMYAQFNVDRGRKDHWALYPAPATLPPAAVESGPQPATPLDAAQQRLAELQSRLKAAEAQRDRAVAEKRPAADVARLERLTRVEQREVKRLGDEIERLQREQQEASDPAYKAWKSVVDRVPLMSGMPTVYSRHWYRRQGFVEGFTWAEDDFSRHDVERFRVPASGSSLRSLLSGRSRLNERHLSILDDSRITSTIDLNGIDAVVPLTRLAHLDIANESDDLRDLVLEDLRLSQWATERGTRLIRSARPEVRRRAKYSGYDAQRSIVEEGLSRFDAWSDAEYVLDSDGRKFWDASGQGRQFGDSAPNFWSYSNGTALWYANGESADESARQATASPYRLLRRSANNGILTAPFASSFHGNLGWALVPLPFDRDWSTDFRQGSRGYIPVESNFLLTREFETESDYEFLPQRLTFVGGAGGGMGGGGFGMVDGRYRFVRPYRPYAASPVFGGLIRDLPSYAPGLQTWDADRSAIVEQALPEDRKPARGRVDDEARRIVDKARSLGWRKFRAVAADEEPAAPWIQANGAGQFVCQRETLDGLVEQIVCDGSTLWQLYADIGLGAKRSLSRFHQPALQSLLPGYVPSVDDLSVGADVTVAGERTIRITPRDVERKSPAAKEEKQDVAGKDVEKSSQPAPKRILLAAELEFAQDGRLAEIRVIDRESGKLLAKQTYSADGVVRRFDGAGKQLAEQRFESHDCEAPQLVPETRDLVVLPLPFRSMEGAPVSVTVDLQTNAPDYAKLTDDEALLLTATYFAAARPNELNALLDARYSLRNDKRVGFTVLRSAVQHNHPFVMNATAQHPDSPVARYLAQADSWIWTGNLNGTLDGGPHASKFLRNLCGIYNHLSRWQSDRGVNKERPAEDVSRDLTETLKFVRAQQSPAVMLGVLSAVHDAFERHSRWTPVWAKQLQDAAESLATERDWPRFAASLRVQWLLAAGDEASQKRAEEFYAKQLCDVVAAGGLPVADASLREAFVRAHKQKSDQPCAPWGRAIRRAADDLASRLKDADGAVRRYGLLELARQCAAAQEKLLATEIAALAMRDQDLANDRPLNLAVLRYAQSADDWKLAEDCFQRTFADGELVKQGSLWRDAAHAALQQQNVVEWARRMERALELEYDALPPTVDLATFRADYANVLGQLERSLDHAKEAKLPGRDDLLVLLDRMAERWRELDPEETTACHRLAEVYAKVGQAKTAWDYWTTPLSEAPDQSSPWQQFASRMQQQGRFVDADRAWTTACELEPTNADLLLGHAEFLKSQQQLSRARELWRRVAEGTWQPRFEPSKQRAVQLLSETK